MKDPDASPSAAGYGYQYERALYRIFTAPNAQTKFGIETADDVEEISQTAAGTRRVSEQAKLSVQPRKNPLQDSSKNLWKTLRIWLSGLAAARKEHEALQYLFVTNRILKKGTLAMRLSDASSKQEVAEAVVALRTHASGMTGKPGEIARDVIAYSDADLAFLIEHMHIEDGQLNAQMKQRVIASLHLPEDAVANAETIYHGLVGFLFDQCQETWVARKPFWTTAQPYYNKRQALVEAFMNGPWEPLPFEKTDFAQWAQKIDPADMLFVEQLNKINMPKDLLMQQFGFFCAAYSERIRLLDSGRVLLNDLDSAERVLSDRWGSINSRHRLTSMKSVAQFEIADYNVVMISTLFPDTFPMKVGRVNSTAQYLFSGTYHRMANGDGTQSPIHWHRDASTPEDES
ncbi:hypothetical protein D3C76_660250 [compost metagenome]|jgi:hypothetical protein